MRQKVFKTRLLPALMLFAALAFAFPAKAQVTIGSGVEPDPNALLDLKEGVGTDETASKKGLLLPRVALVRTTDPNPQTADVQGMYVYNTATANDVFPGIYYNDGDKWVRENSPKWFYLPSFNLDLNVAPGGTKTINLYRDVYQKQGTKTGNSNYVVSTNATAGSFAFATNKPLYTLGQLVFVVTDYDSSVIKVTSIIDGIMTYTVLNNDPPAGAYINIICVVK